MWDLLLTYWPIVLVAVMIFAAAVLSRILIPRVRYPYSKRSRLVTKSELRFYRALFKAVDPEWAIFAMVRIADLLRVKKDTKNRQSWLNRVLSKHIDFVLCDPRTLEPKVAIELDDASHSRPDRQRRDEFVDWAFHSAEFPLLRVEVASEYEADALREMIDDAVA